MRRRSSRSRGLALVLVLFVLFIMAVLGFAAISIATLDSQAATQEQKGMMALNLARAGISRAYSNLRLDYTWGTSSALNYSLEGGSYTVSVFASPNNLNNPEKYWKVTSSGSYSGATRTIEAWLQLESFSKFAYFTNSELGQSGQAIYFVGTDKITGAAHTNGYFRLYQNPQFSQAVTSTNNTDADFKSTTFTYTQGGQSYTDPSKFYRYYNGYPYDYPKALNGSSNFSFAGGQPDIALPSSTAQLKSEANYVFNGSATLVFNSDGTVTVKRSGMSNQTVPTSPVETIYVAGQASVSGTVKGRVTLAASGGINVTDNLVYNDKTQDVLGMISDGQIQVATNPNQYKNIEIDAAIMTLNNSFTVQYYNSGSPRGTLTVFGGVIQKNRGPVGTFNPYTGSIGTGYSKNYIYDDKLINMPPPNFPTTGNIVVKAFEDLGALGSM